MRIAFIIDQFPTLSETFILGQITGAIARGHEVDIFTDRPGNTTKIHPEVESYGLLDRTYYTPIPSNIIWRCLKGIFLLAIYFVQAPRTIIESFNSNKYSRSRYGESADFFKPLYLLVPFLNREKYDIIHCHYGRNGLKAALLKDLGITKAKIIVTFHGNDLSRYLQIHGKDVYSYLFTKADLLQPISHYWQQKLIALGCDRDKIMVHHMGIDLDKFAPSKTLDEAKPILIVSVARLVEKKGLTYGIQAIANLLKKHPELQIRYQIVGDGILKQQLEAQIEDLQMSKEIELLGWQEQQQVRAIIARADIILAPSVTGDNGDCEGIPVSLMEAMAQEIPVVSTYHSGIPELVEDGVSGYLVQERDVTALTAKLEHLIAHPELRQRMGRAGRTKVMHEYNVERLCDRLIEIYQQSSA